MRAVLHQVEDGVLTYSALMFWCPGCQHLDSSGEPQGGLHMLPVNSTVKSPSWGFDGNLEAPTLAPSILTRTDFYTGPSTPPRKFICHSYLRAGYFEFLSDCTHPLVGQTVELPHLPDWALA